MRRMPKYAVRMGDQRNSAKGARAAGATALSASMPAKTVMAATNFPTTMSVIVTGDVTSSSIVLSFFSSANRRMVRIGTTRSRMTAML